MSDYEMCFWFTFSGAVCWANMRAKDTGKRQRVECVDAGWANYRVVPAKPPVVTT
jgi:hypothetical protein